jgi:DDE superfamily endonuclease
VLKPWQKQEWCIPVVSPEFVWRMEDILALYAEPYDPRYPVVCVDESPYQLVSEARQPLPMVPGQPTRYDYEYRREGTCNLFMFFQPLKGWRHVKVTDRRTAKDFAYCMQELVDVHFPKAALISVVLDNLNTHTPAALYEAFPPAEARRLLRKLDFRYTPKHGSWLNMAEIEFAVVSKQGLDQRLPTQEMVRRTTTAWETQRNAVQATVHWRFTIAKARRKLKRLYPSQPVC